MIDRERRRHERGMLADKRTYEKSFRRESTPGYPLLWAGAFIVALLSASVVAEKMNENEEQNARFSIGSAHDTSSK